MRILATLFLIFTIAFGPHAANAIEYCEYDTEEQCKTHSECYWHNEGNGKAPYCEINCNQYSWEQSNNRIPNAKEQCEALGMCTYKQYEYSGRCSFMTKEELESFCQSKETKEDCEENKACDWNWIKETCDSYNTTNNLTIYGHECNTNNTGFFLNETKSKCITCNTKEGYGNINNKCELCNEPNQVISSYNCLTCREGYFPYNNQCLPCRFGTQSNDGATCNCWVGVEQSRACADPVEYVIKFDNNSQYTNDSTGPIFVRYDYKSPNIIITLENLDKDPDDTPDTVYIKTPKPNSQNTTHLFTGWQRSDDSNIQLIPKITKDKSSISAKGNINEVIAPSELTTKDTVYTYDDYDYYGRELKAIWETCRIKYQDGTATECTCKEQCYPKTETTQNPEGEKLTGWICAKEDTVCTDQCTTKNEIITSCNITYAIPTLVPKFEVCPAGYYCPENKGSIKCPAGSTSKAGSTAITDCYMTGNTTQICDKNRCFTLPADAGQIYYHRDDN